MARSREPDLLQSDSNNHKISMFLPRSFVKLVACNVVYSPTNIPVYYKTATSCMNTLHHELEKKPLIAKSYMFSFSNFGCQLK